jgi:hypothetical protein
VIIECYWKDEDFAVNRIDVTTPVIPRIGDKVTIDSAERIVESVIFEVESASVTTGRLVAIVVNLRAMEADD